MWARPCKVHTSPWCSIPQSLELQVPFAPSLAFTPTRSMPVNGHSDSCCWSATLPFAFWVFRTLFSSSVSMCASASRTMPSSLAPMSSPASWVSGSGWSLAWDLSKKTMDSGYIMILVYNYICISLYHSISDMSHIYIHIYYIHIYWLIIMIAHDSLAFQIISAGSREDPGMLEIILIIIITTHTRTHI